jgi:putative DNA primase/helicase
MSPDQITPSATYFEAAIPSVAASVQAHLPKTDGDELVGIQAGATNEAEGAPRDNEPDVEWPHGYALNDDGLSYDDDRISGPFRVLGKARNKRSTGWGIAIEWHDPDGVRHCEVVSHSDLIGGHDVIKTLVDGGLRLATDLKSLNRFREALNGVRCQYRVRLVDRTGWHGAAFVLPDQVIGHSSERLQYVGPHSGARFALAGSLDEWKCGVASLASGNPHLLFALSLALSGPLFGMLNERPIGIHFRGGSSTGKTTLLIAAGSVWGGGNPSSGFCGSWRATVNGLEGIAVAHSGTCLALDELAEIDPQEAMKAAYALINGTGKARAGRTGDARNRAEWCVPILSSGEISLAEKIAEDRGRQSRAGVDVRLIDVAADAGKGYGVFEFLHDRQNAAAFSDELRHAALERYGTAGPAFVEILAARFDVVMAAAGQRVDALTREMTAGAVEGQLHRVARCFAIIGVAGEFARVALDLDWKADETINAALRHLADWKASRGACAAELTRALQAIRVSIDRHGQSRFDDLRKEVRLPARDRLGFRCDIQKIDCWAITVSGWKEVVGSVADPLWVGRQLKDRGWVLVDSTGRWQVPHKVDGCSTRVVAIPVANLEKFDVA